jgi:hypothetical protein
MMNTFSRWWMGEEIRLEGVSSARYVLHKVSDLLWMAGYKPSVQGLHSLSPTRLSLEYLVEEADEITGEYSRHRLFTLFQDGSKFKLTTQRRRLPLETTPRWRRGSTTVLSENVESISFTFISSEGAETDVPGEVSLVVFSLCLKDSSLQGMPISRGGCYRTAVFLRNLAGRGET